MSGLCLNCFRHFRKALLKGGWIPICPFCHSDKLKPDEEKSNNK